MPNGRFRPEVTSGPVYECEAATGWKFGHTPILPVDDSRRAHTSSCPRQEEQAQLPHSVRTSESLFRILVPPLAAKNPRIFRDLDFVSGKLGSTRRNVKASRDFFHCSLRLSIRRSANCSVSRCDEASSRCDTGASRRDAALSHCDTVRSTLRHDLVTLRHGTHHAATRPRALRHGAASRCDTTSSRCDTCVLHLRPI